MTVKENLKELGVVPFMLALWTAWAALFAFLAQVFLLIVEGSPLSFARFSSAFSVLMVIAVLGASYYIIEAMAKKPQSWLGKAGKFIQFVAGLTGIAIAGYALVKGLEFLYLRSSVAFLTLCGSAAFLICYYITGRPEPKD